MYVEMDEILHTLKVQHEKNGFRSDMGGFFLLG